MGRRSMRTVSDFILIFIGTTIELCVHEFMTPTRRGFFCDDESIRYPFQSETVPEWEMYLFTILVVIAIILPIEFWKGRHSVKLRRLGGMTVPEWVNEGYTHALNYVVTFLYLHLAVDIAKRLLGCLRPNFIDRCQPNIDLTNCSKYPYTYITDYTCQHGDEGVFRQSFPSGHAAYSAYACIFLIQYIQIKLEIDQEGSLLELWKLVIQILIASGYFVLILTRYMDNWHHPFDLLIGTFMGALFGLYKIVYVDRLTKSGRRLSASFDERRLLLPTEKRNLPSPKP